MLPVFGTVMPHSHCTESGPSVELGKGPGTMGYHILRRAVHTALGLGMGSDPLSPIVPVMFPVPVPFPLPCSVNVP